MAEKPVHCLVVHRAFSEVDDALEEQIGFLKLVEEEIVVLRQLEFRHPFLSHDLGAEHVESGEQPASSGTVLVGDSLTFHPVGEMSVETVFCVRIRGEFVDVVSAQSVADSFFRRRKIHPGFHPFEHLRSYTSVLFCVSCRIRECHGSQRECY